MNLKRIVSIISAAAIAASMAMSASAYSYTNDNGVLTWDFVQGKGTELENIPSDNGISFTTDTLTRDTSGNDTGAIQLKKNGTAIVYTPSVDGILTITTNSNFIDREVHYGTTHKKSDDPVIQAASTEASVILLANNTYYIYNESSTTKLRSLEFKPTTITADAGAAIVSDDSVTDGSIATGFIAAVTNGTGEEFSTDTIAWAVISSSKAQTEVFNSANITLANGSSLTMGVIVTNLHDASAKATVTLK